MEENTLINSSSSLVSGSEDYYVKSSSEKEDSRKVLTLEPYETHFGKSNVRQTLELEGSGLATRKVSWLFILIWESVSFRNTPRLKYFEGAIEESIHKFFPPALLLRCYKSLEE
ncbi:hypothetical protein LOK49_LG10G01031 [Camellia lanceoleosa]|uniref:Uncharacterized protein n=1 Tax=Camellia lanceoleosa TaxID=1840588 RepID=A0ACC0G748_9ERIC|nr:hypothetical protein LOK49_LG10G01031 [Camellia lanceoleosa]